MSNPAYVVIVDRHFIFPDRFGCRTDGVLRWRGRELTAVMHSSNLLSDCVVPEVPKSCSSSITVRDADWRTLNAAGRVCHQDCVSIPIYIFSVHLAYVSDRLAGGRLRYVRRGCRCHLLCYRLLGIMPSFHPLLIKPVAKHAAGYLQNLYTSDGSTSVRVGAYGSVAGALFSDDLARTDEPWIQCAWIASVKQISCGRIMRYRSVSYGSPVKYIHGSYSLYRSLSEKPTRTYARCNKCTDAYDIFVRSMCVTRVRYDPYDTCYGPRRPVYAIAVLAA